MPPCDHGSVTSRSFGTDQPTDRLTDRPGHREISLPVTNDSINSIYSINYIIYMYIIYRIYVAYVFYT